MRTNKFTPPDSMRIAAPLLALYSSIAIGQTTYYIDAYIGNDNWAGTQKIPQNENGPWKTLNKANHTAFKTGDTILLKCGSIWHEELKLNSNDSTVNSLKVGNYGEICNNKNKPAIDAADPIRNWTLINRKNGIYSASIATDINQVFIDNTPLKQARHPNGGATFLTTSTTQNNKCTRCETTTSFITDPNSFLTKEQIEGSIIHVRINEYIIDDFIADSYDTETRRVSLSTSNSHRQEASHYPIQEGWGYYLSNKAWMLDYSPGWAIENNTLFIRLPDKSSPTDHIIEASPANSIGIESNILDIAIHDISVSHAGDTAVQLNNPGKFHLSDLVISNSGHTGIGIYGQNTSSNLETGIIEKCKINDSARRGIYIQSQTNTTVSGNTVTNTGTTGWPIRSYGAIWSLISDKNKIINNSIINSGYIGIQIQGQENNKLQNSLVEGNVIENSCLVLDDCGAIYIQGFGGTRSASLPSQNSTIQNNVIINTTGNSAGRPMNSTNLAAGIYLDDYTNGVNVYGNTVTKSAQGVFLHNAFNNNIERNTIYQNSKNEVLLSESGNYPVTPMGVMKNNSFKNNTIINSRTSTLIAETSTFGTSGFASYESNHYANLYTDELAAILTKSYSFDEWRQQFSMDLNSSYLLKTDTPTLITTKQLSSNLIINPTFNKDTTNWTSWNSTITKTSNCPAGQNSSCMHATNNNSTTGLVSSNPVSLKKGSTYLLEFSIHSDNKNMTFRTLVRQNHFPYEALGLDKRITSNMTWKKASLPFEATDETEGRIDFQLEPGQSVFIDNVSLKEADFKSDESTSNASRILINRTSSTKAFTCQEKDLSKCSGYIDPLGNPIRWPINLKDHSSAVIIMKRTTQLSALK